MNTNTSSRKNIRLGLFHGVIACAALAVSPLLLAFASPVQAAVIGAYSQVAYDEAGGGSSREGISGPLSTNSTGAVSSIANYNANGLITTGSASAEYGALRAYAFSMAPSDSDALASGAAYWIDQLTISNSALTGTSAFARASFSLSGVLASNFSGVGLVNPVVAAYVRIDGRDVAQIRGAIGIINGVTNLDRSEHGLALNGGALQWYPGITGVFTFDIPFVFGTPFQLFASLGAETRALAGVGGAADAISDFGSSGYWEGIGEVHLANGTVLSGYSLSSDSGFDWSNAYVPQVPVPAAVWLFGSGLLGLVGVARRKARGRAQ